MNERGNTLLFIPDISGFTQFVKTTEISHSRHIISELLEIIINSDQSGMSVSEIEGDAVLFFKKETISVTDLVKQCEITFTNFHRHIRRYDKERICRCGACETAVNLSLKFIIHAGPVENIHIKGHEKLHGKDVILAHKLLKNSINNQQYILVSEGISFEEDEIKTGNRPWLEILPGSENFSDIGKVDYKYIPLNHFPLDKSEPKGITFPELSSHRIVAEEVIDAPVDVVYDSYTDLDKRVLWNDNIKEISLTQGNLNKSGSVHACLIGSDTLDIESIGRAENEHRVVYGERLNEFKGLRDIINIFTFEKRGDATVLKVEVDYKIKSWMGRMLKPIIQGMLKRQTETALKKLKRFSEGETAT